MRWADLTNLIQGPQHKKIMKKVYKKPLLEEISSQVVYTICDVSGGDGGGSGTGEGEEEMTKQRKDAAGTENTWGSLW